LKLLARVSKRRQRLGRGGVAFIVVQQPDGSFACLPAWMTHETEIGMAPAFSLTALRTLRNEVDALLGLLGCESTTERAEHDAGRRILKSRVARG
jgi:hypothetical protein